MNNYDYDLIVVGGGAAGFTASKTALGLGKKVAMIEKKKLGGECTHTGCIPSKALIQCAKIAKHIKDCKNYGISLNGSYDINTDNVMEHVRGVVEKIYQTHSPETFEKIGIKVFFASPHFIDNHTVEINGQKITSKKFILCTGSSPAVPRLEGLDNVSYLTNKNVFSIKKIPASMTIIGGGPIGIEMAQAFTRLGTEVTVLVRSKILPKDDVELTDMLHKRLVSEGVKFVIGMQILKVYENNLKITTEIKTQEGTKNITSDTIFIATGRKPNLEGLNLEDANVIYSDKGVQVTNVLQTSANNIYACGDIVMPYQFSHISEYEAAKAAMNAFLPVKQTVNYSNIIWATFTEPEFAHAGMTEKEARTRYGNKIKIHRYKYDDIDRAQTDNASTGLAKFIYLSSGKILGAHILGARAGDIIHEAQILKTLNMSFYNISKVIHAYPTYADITRQAGKKAYVKKLLNNPIVKLVKSFGK
ncbi:MAG TPA: FAD-dependent oxidoreductase [Elusimicrobiales bacterium]|nr:FAD-dependent oxidoreductase [Elusimicrobiales bacterium]